MNNNCFNTKQWEKWIKEPLWYLNLAPEIQRILNLRDKDRNLYEKCKEEMYTFFENHLKRGDIFLGTEGKQWDKDKKPIDTIVIHHTSMPLRLTKERLSAVELARLYVSHYAYPSESDKDLIGQPIYSAHLREGKQVFYTYHWIIKTDGSSERLLLDNEIGWHIKDNEDLLSRSVALVFDNDYENSRPSDEELRAAAQIIKTYYSFVPKTQIFGHREINSYTVCPSNLFLSSQGIKGWKEDLLNLI